MSVKSATGQSLHYFSRPQSGTIRREPIAQKCAWMGTELMKTPAAYMVELDEQQVQEVQQVVASVIAARKPMASLTVEDFPLPLLRPIIDTVKAELQDGIGFYLVRGFPVEKWSELESECFFWGWGLHIGTCGAQDNDGLLLTHVRDTGADPATERQYKTKAAIDYHCDAADVVGLMCLGEGAEGGESTLVSSAFAYNMMLEKHPDLVEELYKPFLLDTRGTGGINCVPMESVRHDSQGRVRTFWHCEYFKSSYGKIGAPAKMPAQQLAAYEAYNAIIHDKSMAVSMQLKVGDVQMVSNHSILHARSAYEDTGATTKRHLLRLWISIEDRLPFTDWVSKTSHYLTLVSRFANAKLAARFACR